jgi:hypothetical protein
MKLLTVFLTLLLALAACAPPATEMPARSRPNPTATNVTSQAPETPWAIYDPDPDHLWNRLFRQFFRRFTEDGKEYGADELDPLLWFDTSYLLNGDSHQEALQVLDEFLIANAEHLIDDPRKRAMFQRDLWAVFDWLSFQPEPFPAQRQALQLRLVEIIRRVALSREEILSLPDNHKSAIESNQFPTDFQKAEPDAAFLPPDLFLQDSAWVPMGREGGPVAMAHTEGFPFLGRSVFLVLVRAPGGRNATLDFIKALNTDPGGVLTNGMDVALVRRMLLIDEQGELVLSPLVETIQIRHFNPEQIFYEFELERRLLFNGNGSSLRPNIELFLLFSSHGDVFEGSHGPQLEATVPDICDGCHFENPPLPNLRNTQSILSYSRFNFPLPDDQQPAFLGTTWKKEAQLVTEWKTGHSTWHRLQALWGPP